MAEDCLGDAAADVLCAAELRLQMHWLPGRAALDVLIGEVTDELVPGERGPGRVDGDAGQPVRRSAVRRIGHELDARHLGEQVPIPTVRGASSLYLVR